jgi:hypothetical protein
VRFFRQAPVGPRTTLSTSTIQHHSTSPQGAPKGEKKATYLPVKKKNYD